MSIITEEQEVRLLTTNDTTKVSNDLVTHYLLRFPSARSVIRVYLAAYEICLRLSKLEYAEINSNVVTNGSSVWDKVVNGPKEVSGNLSVKIDMENRKKAKGSWKEMADEYLFIATSPRSIYSKKYIK